MPKILAPLLVTAALAAGCSSAETPAPAPESAPQAAPTPSLDTLPEVPKGGQEPCPYLDTLWLADANGQRVLSTGTDPRFDPPACVFYSYDDTPQVTVVVRKVASESEARAMVDLAAPVDSTSPASLDGWEGGRGQLAPSADGTPPHAPAGALSVYAVSQGATAVVVWSNQEQTVKSETIARETIKNLQL